MTSLSRSRRGVAERHRLPPKFRRVLTAVLPRVEITLWSALRDDSLLRWTSIGLTLALLIPFFLTPFLPFADQGINTASADLLWDTMRGRQPLAHFHAIQGPLTSRRER